MVINGEIINGNFFIKNNSVFGKCTRMFFGKLFCVNVPISRGSPLSIAYRASEVAEKSEKGLRSK